jgi:ribosomal protein S18 acetylase RimI-like enzyme
MEYILAKNNEEDFQGFLKLEEEFDRHYVTLGVGEQFVRVSFSEKPEEAKRMEFEKNFKSEAYFLFVKEGEEYVGYISGVIEENDQSYKARQLGIMDTIVVSEKYKGKGISNKMRDMFFEWLKSKNVNICQLHVIAKNVSALEIYKKWGFEIDELRLWKKI